MTKKLLAMLLAVLMVMALFVGCGNSETAAPASGGSGSSGGSESAGSSGSAPAPAASEDEDEDYDDEDIVEINLWGLTLFGTDGMPEVEAAINEISEREIGVHVNITVMDMASYAQQCSLMFSSQESVDIMQTTPIQSAGFSSLTSQKELLPLNDLLPEYAPETNELLGDLVQGTTVDGNIYALTTYRLLNSNCYALMRKDILDDLGLTEKAQNLDNWTDYEAILQAVKDSDYDGGKVATCLANNDNDGTVISVEYAYVGNEDWSQNRGYDTLGDTYKIIAINEDTNTVEDYFESEEYYKMLKLMTDWYKKGLIYKDAATSDEGGDPLIKNGVTFGTVVNSETGVEANRLSTTGYEIVAPMICQEPLSTGSTTKFCWAIPVTAKEPEAAMKFMNLMYTNAEIENLFAWGIEGRDYAVNDQGEAYKLDTNVYNSADFLWGNQFLAYPAEGQGTNFRTEGEAEMKNAPRSKYFGCAVNTDPIANTLTAVYNVIQQYKAGYESGSVPVPDTYEEYLQTDFVKGLQAAGVNDVIDYYQQQLDAWLAEQ